MAAAPDDRAAESELGARVRTALEDAESLVGVAFASPGPRLADSLPGLQLALHEALERLREPKTRRPQLLKLANLLTDLHEVTAEVREQTLRDRIARLGEIRDGLHRLRDIEDPEQLLARVAEETCRSCGFERGVLSKLTDSTWILQDAHFTGDAEWAAEFVRLGAKLRPELSHLVLETEMVRRRVAMLVEDAFNDPRTYKPLVEHSAAKNYVCAPIMPQNQVVGFIHADYYFSDIPLDEFDREALWTFTEGFAHIYERAVLLTRLHRQRDQVQRMVSGTEAVMGELCDAEIALDSEIQLNRRSESGVAVAARAAGTLRTAESPIGELLTKRELEVLALMSSGATNAGIASKLVISEGTVKSHVKHILRKLRAANRAEAVSRYFRLSAPARQQESDPA